MTKLRVGVVIDPFNIPTHGGTFSYYHTLLNGINRFAFDDSIEIVNIVFYNDQKPVVQFRHPSVFIKIPGIVSLKEKVNSKAPSGLSAFLKQNPLVKYVFGLMKASRNSKVEEELIRNKIDLLYYLKPGGEPYNYPFITNHWDVAHRSILPFPEVALNGSYEIREDYYVRILNKAWLILCESQAGLHELNTYYKYNPAKLKVLPIFASDLIQLSVPAEQQEKALAELNVQPQRYFIYPAQFWALKNHYNLILAFKKLVALKEYADLKLVLPGSDKGNKKYIEELVQSLSLQHSVVFAGFVKNEALHSLYKNALALVMPTFLGPTNMPLIEAAYLHCPVLCSDLAGHREIMEEHALYFDPSKAEAIATAMESTLKDEHRTQRIAAAYTHIQQSKFNLDKSLQTLNDLLVSIIPIRKTWGIDGRSF